MSHVSVADKVAVFQVAWKGQRLSSALRRAITSFEFEEHEKKSAEMKLIFTSQSGRDLSPFLVFQVGDELRVKWGRVGDVMDSDRMKVHSITPSYGEQTHVTLVARDLGHDLGHLGGQKVWRNVELRGIVSDLAKDAGLSVVLPQSLPNSSGRAGPALALAQSKQPNAPAEAKLLQRVVSLAQHGRSPRELLHHIAEQVGCELHVVGAEVQFLPKHYTAAPATVLRWQNGQGLLLEFAPHERKGGKHEAAARGTKAVGIDPRSGKNVSASVAEANDKGRAVLGKEASFGGKDGQGTQAGRGVVYVDSQRNGAVVGAGTVLSPPTDKAGAYVPTPSGQQADADAHAKSLRHDAETGGHKMGFRTVGLPSIRRGRTIDLRNVDARRLGLWMAISSTHKIDEGGYFTSGDARRHGANVVGRNKPQTTGQPNQQQAQGAQTTKQVYYRVDSKRGGGIVGTVVR